MLELFYITLRIQLYATSIHHAANPLSITFATAGADVASPSFWEPRAAARLGHRHLVVIGAVLVVFGSVQQRLSHHVECLALQHLANDFCCGGITVTIELILMNQL